MSLVTPTENKALLRVGLGTQTSYEALSGYTAGGIYIAAQGTLADATLAKIYVARSTTQAYGLSADYADQAGKWANARKFSIADAAGTTGTDVDGSNNAILVIPKTLTGFTSITSGTFVGNLTGLASNASRLSNTSAIGSASRPVYFNANGVPVQCDATLGVSVTGNAGTATRLAQAKKITLTGGVTGEVEFDGSGHVEIKTTVTGAGKVNNTLKLTFGTATADEGTNQYTFDGSAAKAIQFIAGDNYIALTPTAGKVTFGAGTALTSLQNTVNTINGSYVKRDAHTSDINATKEFATQEANRIYNKIAGGELPAAFDTLKEIVDYLDSADGNSADALLSTIDNKANKDGSNVGTATAKVTWNNLNIGGSAAKWTTPRTIDISGTAGTTGTNVDGSAPATLVIPKTLTGFTSITSGTFVGNLTGKASALSLSAAVGSTSLPVYFKADGTPAACGTSLAVSITGNAATATSAGKWTTERTFTIKDSASTPHAGTGVKVNGGGNVDLILPTTITATLDGRATSATKLVNSSGTAYSLGAAGKPVYFANGVPVACDGTLSVSITGNAATATNASSADKANSAATAATATSAGKWTKDMSLTIGAKTISTFNYNASGITFAATDIGSTVVWETF